MLADSNLNSMAVSHGICHGYYTYISGALGKAQAWAGCARKYSNPHAIRVLEAEAH